MLKKKLKKQASAAKKRLKLKQNTVSEVSAEESIEEDADIRTLNESQTFDNEASQFPSFEKPRTLKAITTPEVQKSASQKG